MTDIKTVDDFFNDSSTEVASNWFSFDEVGDSIVGSLLFPASENDTKFGPQTVYELEVIASTKPQYKAGDQVKVALKGTSHKVKISQLKSAEVGDRLGFKFKELVDTGKVNPVKSIEVRLGKINK